MAIQRFMLGGDEVATLIRESLGRCVDISFGPKGAWVDWDTDKPIPWYVARLGQLRGVELPDWALQQSGLDVSQQKASGV